jgi:hypothetical protein
MANTQPTRLSNSEIRVAANLRPTVASTDCTRAASAIANHALQLLGGANDDTARFASDRVDHDWIGAPPS